MGHSSLGKLLGFIRLLLWQHIPQGHHKEGALQMSFRETADFGPRCAINPVNLPRYIYQSGDEPDDEPG